MSGKVGELKLLNELEKISGLTLYKTDKIPHLADIVCKYDISGRCCFILFDSKEYSGTVPIEQFQKMALDQCIITYGCEHVAFGVIVLTGTCLKTIKNWELEIGGICANSMFVTTLQDLKKTIEVDIVMAEKNMMDCNYSMTYNHSEVFDYIIKQFKCQITCPPKEKDLMDYFRIQSVTCHTMDFITFCKTYFANNIKRKDWYKIMITNEIILHTDVDM